MFACARKAGLLRNIRGSRSLAITRSMYFSKISRSRNAARSASVHPSGASPGGFSRWSAKASFPLRISPRSQSGPRK